MNVCIIDNYDSFTYNLVDLLYKIDVTPFVVFNDVNIENGGKHGDSRGKHGDLPLLSPSHLIISPGPGKPSDSGISIPLIKEYYKKIPVLGVCLGHQAIGELFNCNINYANTVMHGKVSLIYHNKKGLFKNIPSPFKAVRYHSLIIRNDENFNKLNLEITAWSEKNGKIDEIMAIKHKYYNLYGVQFHPESILSEYGDVLMKNFIY